MSQWQNLVALLIVTAALLAVLRTLWRNVKSKRPGCGCCASCDERVSISIGPQVRRRDECGSADTSGSRPDLTSG